ncbi:MAG TPA: Rrf2 family transcriptional regulator [Polyangiales bacterium]|nr:Rrf2 family transcriptional regulator [Polyangiales bacterium]
MKFSSKGLYGIQAIFDLAFHTAAGAAQIKDICERQAIPPRFLEQVFQDLRKAGIVTSKRGPRGGYQLASPPERIRLGDILRALEGPVQLLPVARSPELVASSSYEVTEQVFKGLSSNVEACLDAVTIADMCKHAEAMGITRRPPPAYVYAI